MKELLKDIGYTIKSILTDIPDIATSNTLSHSMGEKPTEAEKVTAAIVASELLGPVAGIIAYDQLDQMGKDDDGMSM